MTEVLQIIPREVSSSALPYQFEDSKDTRMTHVKPTLLRNSNNLLA